MTTFVGGKSEIPIEFKRHLGKGKNEFGDTILIVKIHQRAVLS